MQLNSHQDANLRSLLYSHFSESLSGLPTIRAYREVPRFLSDNEFYCDLEDRALYLTITNQRWLAVRLGFLGAILVFVVAYVLYDSSQRLSLLTPVSSILAVMGVNGITPAQIGLVLTYTSKH
jgi:ATP-binding cassette subfamily C (CFTR/MRP) protein 1